MSGKEACTDQGGRAGDAGPPRGRGRPGRPQTCDFRGGQVLSWQLRGNHLLLAQRRLTHESIWSALDLTGSRDGLWEQEVIRTLVRPLSLQVSPL